MYKDYGINRIDHNLCMPDQPIWKEYGAVWNCRTVFRSNDKLPKTIATKK